MKSLILILTSLLFISCSNMTIGFEEDSPLYNGPLIDTREDIKSDKETRVEKSTETTELKIQPKQEILSEKEENALVEKTVSNESTQQVEQKASMTPVETEEESETTFYYERDDE